MNMAKTGIEIYEWMDGKRKVYYDGYGALSLVGGFGVVEIVYDGYDMNFYFC